MQETLLTERLELRPVTLPLVLAVLEGRPRREIETLLGAEMPWTWPSRALVEQVFQASLDAIRADPDTRLWGDHLLITRDQPTRVVGSVVFDGKPREDGTCSIAYGVEETSQGKGYGTEALIAVVRWALMQPECSRITAATTAWHKASIRVLEKVGMHLSGERHDPDMGKMLVYEIARSDLSPRDVAVAASRSSLRNARIALVLLAIAVIAIAHQLGVFEQFADRERLRQTLVDLGPWGYLAFVVAFGIVQPLGVPGTVFVIVASLVWPWPIAFALSIMGTMIASTVGFSFARFVARDWVTQFIPERFKKYDDALERRALPTVALLRVVFLMSPLLHAFFGVSRVRFWTHFWGSLLGYLAPLFLMSFFGARAFEWLRSVPLEGWGLLAGVLAVVALALLWRRRAQLRRQA